MSVDEAFRKLMQTDALRGVTLKREAPAPQAPVEVAVPDPMAAATPPVPVEKSVPLVDLARACRVPRFAHHPIDSRSQIAEEYRILRTRLMALELPRPSVLITSCHHNEGKTNTALNLALCMAKRKNSKILLVDFDLRRPRLHRMLGLPQRDVDIVSILRRQCEPEEAMLYSEEDNLYVLAARRGYASGTDLLETKATRELMDRLHATFDFVIVDSCPSLSTSDPAILGPYVGGAMVIVRCLQTQRESIQHAISGLQNLGVNVIGVVLTFMRYFIPRYLYRYQYYHGYGYYHSYGASGNEAADNGPVAPSDHEAEGSLAAAIDEAEARVEA